jgi:hypothetical protein
LKIKDRIRGFCRLAPERIRPNPKNWRTHPEAQRDALKGVLADVGIADAVLVVPCDAGALAGLLAAKDFDAWLRGYRGDFMLVDGHLRTETITGQPVPALVLDLDEREQAEVLATFDPVGDLAGMDRERFIALASEFNSTNPAVQTLVADLAAMEERMRGAADDAGAASDDAEPVIPDSNYKEQYAVVVTCADAADQERVFGRLTDDGYTCKILVT